MIFGNSSKGRRRFSSRFDYFVFLILLLTTLVPKHAYGQEPGKDKPSFTRDIAPLLARKCISCHTEKKAKGSYRTDTFEQLFKPGDGGESPIVAGAPEKSELYRRIVSSDDEERMPQKDDPLPSNDIRIIGEWIRQGAVFDGRDAADPLAGAEPVGAASSPAAYTRPYPILALSFHPEGEEIAVAGYHEITIWKPSSGELLRRIGGLPERIQDLVYTQDGLVIAAAGGAPGKLGAVVLIDAVKGSVERVLGTTSDMMLAVAVSADQKSLAAGGADSAIHLFDLEKRERGKMVQSHADWVMSLQYSADGSRFISASRDRSTRLYHTATSELDVSYAEHNAPVNTATLSVDGRLALSGGRDRKIHLWNVSDGKKAGEITGFEKELTRLLVVNDSLFSACADGYVRQHSIKDRKLVRAFGPHHDRVHALSYNSKTQAIASGSHDGEVKVWNVATGSLVNTFTALPGFSVAKKR